MRTEAEVRAMKRTMAEAGIPLEDAGKDVDFIKYFCGALAWVLEDDIAESPEAQAMLEFGMRHTRN